MAAITMAPATPTALDAVGVAMPNKIEPRTTNVSTVRG